jgi:hypothetical protein
MPFFVPDFWGGNALIVTLSPTTIEFELQPNLLMIAGGSASTTHGSSSLFSSLSWISK